jgi:hypothetical protein
MKKSAEKPSNQLQPKQRRAFYHLILVALALAGMGLVSPLASDAGKVFAAVYALFSGLMFIGATGIVLSPVFHRVLHKFHVEERDLK